MYTHIYVYIYICIERERGRDLYLYMYISGSRAAPRCSQKGGIRRGGSDQRSTLKSPFSNVESLEGDRFFGSPLFGSPFGGR